MHLVFRGMHCVFGILGRIKQLVHWEHQQTGQVEDFGMLGYLGGLLLQFRGVHLVSRGLYGVFGILCRIKQLVHWEQRGRVGEQQQGGEIEFPVIIVRSSHYPREKALMCNFLENGH